MEILISDIKFGMVGLSGGQDWIQRQIKFFSAGIYSHSFVIMAGVFGSIALETTTTIVCPSPMERKVHELNVVDVWEPIAGDDAKMQATKETYEKYAAAWYGYLSYIWFMYRWLMRKFKHEPTTMWSWCVNGVTCTELTCFYLSLLGPEFAKLFLNIDLNTQSPEELLELMKSRPDLFRYCGTLKRDV